MTGPKDPLAPPSRMENDIPGLIAGVVEHTRVTGAFLEAAPYGSGHINDTFVATYDDRGRIVRYIHQRINHHVFKDPVALMNNIERVTRHVHDKLAAAGEPEIARKTLILVPTHDGGPYYRTRDGSYWRTYVFIEGARTYDAVKNPEQAFQAGRAFGAFQCQLTDLDGPQLADTLPDFHNTPKRFADFERAVERDPCNRAAAAKPEIDFVLRHKPIVSRVTDLMAQGEIPQRTTHNDTKFNNVMLDDVTGEGICVIDLDTVMPGSVLYDFGDMVRTTTSFAKEDDRDLSKVHMEMPMFEGLLRGYLSTAGAFLNRAEKALLPFAGKLITLEIGLRFLADYLEGDTYFKIHRPGHNLDRCRTQFALIESITAQEGAMNRLVDSL